MPMKDIIKSRATDSLVKIILSGNFKKFCNLKLQINRKLRNSIEKSNIEFAAPMVKSYITTAHSENQEIDM